MSRWYSVARAEFRLLTQWFVQCATHHNVRSRSFKDLRYFTINKVGQKPHLSFDLTRIKVALVSCAVEVPGEKKGLNVMIGRKIYL
jgi:hypothetical protein